MNQKRVATSPAHDNQGKRPDDKDSPTSPSTGLFGYLFPGGAQKSMVVAKSPNPLSPIARVAEEQGIVGVTSDSFLRAYEEESRANLNRWSPSKTAELVESVVSEKRKQAERSNPLNTGGEELSDEHPGFVEPIFSEKE